MQFSRAFTTDFILNAISDELLYKIKVCKNLT